MKPFLSLSPEKVPQNIHYGYLLRSWGPYDAPDPVFTAQFRDVKSKMWEELEGYAKMAGEAWRDFRAMGARGCKASGSEEAWGKEIQGSLETCEALREAITRLKEAAGRKEEDGRVGVTVDLKRSEGVSLSEGWLVAKVVADEEKKV